MTSTPRSTSARRPKSHPPEDSNQTPETYAETNWLLPGLVVLAVVVAAAYFVVSESKGVDPKTIAKLDERLRLQADRLGDIDTKLTKALRELREADVGIAREQSGSRERIEAIRSDARLASEALHEEFNKMANSRRSFVEAILDERAAAYARRLGDVRSSAAETREATAAQRATLQDASAPAPTETAVAAVPEAAPQPASEHEQYLAELRHEMETSSIAQDLRAFTTHGYWQPKQSNNQTLGPIRLSQLQRYGAMAPTEAGLKLLTKVASYSRDTLRPRWGGLRAANAVPLAQRVQAFLIQHGQGLVELGYLAP